MTIEFLTNLILQIHDKLDGPGGGQLSHVVRCTQPHHWLSGRFLFEEKQRPQHIRMGEGRSPGGVGERGFPVCALLQYFRVSSSAVKTIILICFKYLMKLVLKDLN